MSFADLQREAREGWEAFERLDVPRLLIGAVTCGRAAGAIAVREAFEREFAARSIRARLYDVGCLGLCYAEPLVEVGTPGGRRVLYAHVTPEAVPALVRDAIAGGGVHADLALAWVGEAPVDGLPRFEDLPMVKGQARIVLANAGFVDPSDLRHYVARGGYAALEQALRTPREAIIDAVSRSGLRGRGGAGFPTGTKWRLAAQAPGDVKYVICNADEGDPGAFMDRSVLESDPHAVLEGLLIAGYAVGARDGYIYVRAEYPLAVERVRGAIRQLEERGLAGDRVLGTDFTFRFHVKEGAGAFVCGEETALIASIEGRRGMPRPRPPFPAQSGLHGKPTNINNVETLANVPAILRHGPEWFAAYGTARSKGTKTFALAGKIRRTGLIEVPMGMPLRDIIFGLGGGIPNDRAFKTVQTGGPSGGCLPASLLDLPVDYEELAKAGSIMGSGGMIVMDDESCMVDVARYFLEFTHHESCGKCTPCRLGSEHMLRILTDITEGKGTPEHVRALEDLARTVKFGSLCGLGQTLPNPVFSALRYFREELEDHVVRRRCPAGVCRALFEYRVDAAACRACGKCRKACNFDAVEGAPKVPHRILAERCTRCGACFQACPFDAIAKVTP